MKAVDLYARVRRACHVEGMSQRQAARLFGIDPKTVAKMLRFSVPPGYRRSKPPVRPKLAGVTGVIDRILEEDRGRPGKQRHTARRIFQRLRAEHGFTGGETIVRAYVRERRLQGREMFVPLVHPPGHGQAGHCQLIQLRAKLDRMAERARAHAAIRTHVSCRQLRKALARAQRY
jgi:transposase